MYDFLSMLEVNLREVLNKKNCSVLCPYDVVHFDFGCEIYDCLDRC